MICSDVLYYILQIHNHTSRGVVNHTCSIVIKLQRIQNKGYIIQNLIVAIDFIMIHGDGLYLDKRPILYN